MSDVVSTLALRVNSENAVHGLRVVTEETQKLAQQTQALGDVSDFTKGRLISLISGFASWNFGKILLDNAIADEQAALRYGKTFKGIIDQADAAGKELQNSYFFQEGGAQESLSVLGDKFKQTGLTARQALDLSVQVHRMAADFAAYSHATGGTEEVLRSMQMAVTGNTRALMSQGIVLDDAAINAEVLAMKQRGVAFASDKAAIAVARVNELTKALAMSEGTISANLDSYANNLRRLEARWGDFEGSLGAVFLPLANKVVDAAADMATALNDMSPATKTVMVGIGAATGAFLTFGPTVLKVAEGLKVLSISKTLDSIANKQNAESVVENTAALVSETSALSSESAAEATSAANSMAVVTAKNAEAAARERNAAAALQETKFQNPLSQAQKRDAKIQWRARTKSQRLALAPDSLSDYVIGDSQTRVLKSQLAAKRGMALDSAGKLVRGSNASRSALSLAESAALGPLKGVLKPLQGLDNIFTNLATKLPLVSRFGSVFARVLGLFGTSASVVGAVVGAFEIFKRTPEWLEVAFEQAPAVFASIGTACVNAVKGLTTKAITYGKDLVVQGTLGFAQTAKRLMGFETEASRAYKLNKQIEANNQRRQELLEQEQKQRTTENAMLNAQTSAQRMKKEARLGYAETKETDSVKLTGAIQQRDTLSSQISSAEHKIQQLRTDSTDKNVTQEQRDSALEEINQLTENLKELNEQWKKSSEEVDKLAETVDAASKSFADDQKAFAQNKTNNDKEFANTQLQTNLDNATNHAERSAALTAIASRAQEDFNATETAQTEADNLNAQAQNIQNQLQSEFANKAMVTLQELAQSGDQSPEALTKWAGALLQLEKAGYQLNDEQQVFGANSAENLYTQMTNTRKEQEKQLPELLAQRDEQQAIANEKSSRFTAMNSANNAVQQENEEYADAQAERAKQEQEKQAERQRNYSQFQNQLEESYFQRALKTTEQSYGDDRFGAAQARYGMISTRGAAQWNQSQEQLSAMEAQLGEYDKQLNEYKTKEDNGLLTEREAKQRDEIQAERDKLQNDYDSEYQSAVQRRLSTEDELLGLQNTMKEEYLSQAKEQVDEQANAMKEQLLADAQAEEEAQKQRLEERSKVEEEQRQAVAGQRAITAGSSEAFNIASKIYDRGQENLPPEKRIEKSTAKIEAYVKSMQEQMMRYYSQQADGLTLAMEF